MHYISNILLKHAEHINSDPWRGLPELTNNSESRVVRQSYFLLPFLSDSQSCEMTVY